MKKITLFFALIIGSYGFSQSMPIDFESPEDDNWGGFNGTVATVLEDPTDNTNTVLELAGAGVDFDGAALELDTYVDLSDDSNNTVSMRIWAPDATTRTHLLKFEGGSSGATELYFNTDMMGWQTVNIDFGPNLGTEYPKIVIFTDSGSGNTATGTYYIDDIDGPNGAVIPADEVPAGPAPEPTLPDNDVLSFYNDVPGYTNVWTAEYSFGTAPAEVDLGGNNAWNFNLASAGWGQGRNAVVDISNYDTVEFDYWADSGTQTFTYFLIGNSGSVTEYTYKIGDSGQEAILNQQWVHVEIPLTYFEGLGFNKTDFFQWKLDKQGTAATVYIDNLLFSGNALSNDEFTTAEFTVSPNPSNTVWSLKGQTQITAVQVFDLLGKEVISVQPNALEVELDASNLNTGLYLAKVASSTGTKTIKLVKN